MSKYTVQDVNEENSTTIIKAALDPNYFLIQDFGAKDKTPDIDGHLRLRDGNGTYLNRYLHYQLKSVAGVKGSKYSCSRKILDYLRDTNIPTLLLVVDTESKRSFWYYLDKKAIAGLGLDADCSSRTLDLRRKEIKGDMAALCSRFAGLAVQDDYSAISKSLAGIVEEYQLQLCNCIGMLFLLQKAGKDECPELFQKILGIPQATVAELLHKLTDQGVITATKNLYIVDNEELGRDCLNGLLEFLGEEGLGRLFEAEEDRLLILRQLGQSDNSMAEAFLKIITEEFGSFARKPTGNDALATILSFLDAYSYRLPDETISICKHLLFTKKTLPVRTEKVIGWGPVMGKSHSDIQKLCVNILKGLRYHRPRKVVRILLRLAATIDSDVSKEVADAFKGISEYDLYILQQIGFGPQTVLLEELEKLGTGRLRKLMKLLAETLEYLLNPGFEGSRMTDYRTVSLTRGSLIASPNLKRIRRRSLQLLVKLYDVNADPESRRRIVRAVDRATHTPRSGKSGAKERSMIMADIRFVCRIYIVWLKDADYRVIQQIEKECSYLRHARSSMTAVKALDRAISGMKDYQFYRIFIGYDHRLGITGDFDAWEAARLAQGEDIISAVDERSYRKWKQPLLRVLRAIPPDDPGQSGRLNQFFFSLAKTKPEVALLLLSEHESLLAPAMTHLMAGLWKSSNRKTARDLMAKWIETDKYLGKLSRVFAVAGEADLAILKRIATRSKAQHDACSLANVLETIGETYPRGNSKQAKALLIYCITNLVKEESQGWLGYLPYRAKGLFQALSKREWKEILNVLVPASSVGDELEELLKHVADGSPELLIDFFRKRALYHASGSGRRKNRDDMAYSYDAIPFQFHRIQSALSMHAGAVVPMILRWYSRKDWRMWWDASHLINIIFPAFDPILERELNALLRTKSERASKIVLSILETYEGQAFLYPVCEEYARRFGQTKEKRQRLMGALIRTGVVCGEYGMAEAYEAKRQTIHREEKSRNRQVRLFWEEYEEFLLSMGTSEKERAEEAVVLRKKNIR